MRSVVRCVLSCFSPVPAVPTEYPQESSRLKPTTIDGKSGKTMNRAGFPGTCTTVLDDGRGRQTAPIAPSSGAAFRQSRLFWQAADFPEVIAAISDLLAADILVDRVSDHRRELFDQTIGNATAIRQVMVALELRDRATGRIVQYS